MFQHPLSRKDLFLFELWRFGSKHRWVSPETHGFMGVVPWSLSPTLWARLKSLLASSSSFLAESLPSVNIRYFVHICSIYTHICVYNVWYISVNHPMLTDINLQPTASRTNLQIQNRESLSPILLGVCCLALDTHAFCIQSGLVLKFVASNYPGVRPKEWSLELAFLFKGYTPWN